MKHNITHTTKHTVTGTISNTKLIELIKQDQPVHPSKYNFWIEVPGGGDWSNTQLNIGEDVDLNYRIEWSETNEVCEEDDHR